MVEEQDARAGRPDAYEPPVLTVLGTAENLTLGPEHGPPGHGVLPIGLSG